MRDFIKGLQEKRANIWEQGKTLLDTASEANRDLTDEEETSWQKMNADLNALDQRIKDILDAEARAQANAKTMEDLERQPQERHATDGDDKVLSEVRSFLRGERRSVTIAPTTSFRDLVKGTATAGGHTVKTSLYDQIVLHMIGMSAILSAGPTVLETASGENLDIPITTAFGSASLTAEGAAINESDPTFGKRTLSAYKYGKITQISRELIDDSSFDLQSFVAQESGMAVGNGFGAALVTGTGSSQPSGIVTGATTGVTGSSSPGVAGAFTADNLIDLYFSVIAPYRNSRSCAWIMKDATMGAVRKLKDTTGQYLWQPSVQVGVPDSLLGKPVFTDPNVAAVGLGAKSVVFGDISRYFVRIAGGVRFERSDDFAFNQDLVSFKAVIRGDGVLVDQTGAVKLFVGGAS